MRYIIPVFLIVLSVGIAIGYGTSTETMEYDLLTKEHVSEKVIKGLEANRSNESRFSIYEDEQNTYVSYIADHEPNEYMSLDIRLENRAFNRYAVIATIDHALHDTEVVYERIIQFEKTPTEHIVFKEENNK